jgi:hypothetical protein
VVDSGSDAVVDSGSDAVVDSDLDAVVDSDLDAVVDSDLDAVVDSAVAQGELVVRHHLRRREKAHLSGLNLLNHRPAFHREPAHCWMRR